MTKDEMYEASRAFGRQERSRFYDRILQLGDATCIDAAARLVQDNMNFATEFSQLCAEDDEAMRKRLRPSLPSKLCVLHLDGNGFGKAISALAGKPPQLEALSTYIRLRQAQLLAAAVNAAMDCPDMRFADADRHKRLRLQTLLWGGDEMTFVMPAWFGFDFFAKIEPALQGWVPMHGTEPLSEGPLTHGVGLIFADRKMPIALLRSLADKVSLSAKAQKPSAGVQALALEGFDLPDTSAEGLRRRLFELPAGMTGVALDASFQLQTKDQKFAEALVHWRNLERDLPRSQAHKLLRKLRDTHKSLRDAHEKTSVADVKDELARVGSTAPNHEALARQLVCASGPARLLPLLTMMHLADYLAPFKERAA